MNQYVSTVSSIAKTIIVLQKTDTVLFGSANKDYEGQYEGKMYTINSEIKVLLPFYPDVQETLGVQLKPIIDRTATVKCESTGS